MNEKWFYQKRLAQKQACKKGRFSRVRGGRALILTIIIMILSVSAYPALAVTEEEAAATIKGIDVSEFNGLVDYEAVKKAGYSHVMVRSGAGKSYVDPNFTLNYGAAGAAGLQRGVYHYSYATTVEDAKEEAKACLKILDNRNLEYPVAYDIEEDAAFETGKDNVTAMAVTFCEIIAAAGYQPMIYASLNKLNDYFDYNSISKYKIWVANYDVDYPNYAYPYAMWQYKIGSVKGANTGGGECDVNYIYEQFVEAASITVSQTELALEIGEGRVSSATLSAVVGNPEATNKHVNWSSEDEKVAVVDANGVVAAIGNGTTNIVASTVNGITAKCAVTVTTPATAIAIGNKSLTIGKKETFSLIPQLTPETSTDATHYVSSDEKIVRVNDDGTLTGVAKGSAEITATTDSGVTTTVTVTVKKAPWKLSGVPLFHKMKVHDTYQMKCELPKDSASNQISYYSRNKYRVSVDENGKVEALKTGWCLLRAKTYNGKKEWMLVHVVE